MLGARQRLGCCSLRQPIRIRTRTMRAYAVPRRRTLWLFGFIMFNNGTSNSVDKVLIPYAREKMHPRMLFPFGVGVMPAATYRGLCDAAQRKVSGLRATVWSYERLAVGRPIVDHRGYETTASMTTMGRLWARFGCAPVRYVVHSDVYKQKQSCILHCNSVIHAYCRGLGPMSRQDVRIRASSSRLIVLWPKTSYGSHIVQPLWEVVLLMGCLLCARRTRLCGIRSLVGL
ncbi:hypothetical protein U9M48_008878 [Paspalum notatum var. saurae]|uniref:Uncharacterized protein n=1 Tax=Paspalum notatum var. saurae TaxID=547442 RepID=A0AAQ3WE39_PASNO